MGNRRVFVIAASSSYRNSACSDGHFSLSSILLSSARLLPSMSGNCGRCAGSRLTMFFPMLSMRFLDGMRTSELDVLPRQLGQLVIVPVQDGHVCFAQFFHIDQPIAGPFDGSHDFVQLEMDSMGFL